MSRGSAFISRRRFLGVAGASFALAGCASSGPSALYGIEAAEVAASNKRRRGAQVLVPRPRALKALDTDNIAVVDSGLIYSYFPKAAWADALPSVVQSKVVQTLQNTNKLQAVGLPGDGLLIDYQLQMEIRSFELRIDGANRGVVEIAAKLVNDRNGRAIANRVFRAEALSGGSTVDKAVEALNRAADKVFADMALWVIARV